MSDVVVDTNVWLDWLVFDDPGITTLRQAVAERAAQPVATPRIRNEVADVLHRPQFSSRLAQPLHALALFDRLVCMAQEPPDCGLACRDSDDQVFIDLAVARGAGWLITKDKALLALARPARKRFGLQVLVPGAFSYCRPAR